MKKLLAVAVLVAAGLTAPALPASAASTTLSKASLDCLIFPMFKKQCWEKAEAMVADAGSSASAAARSVKLPIMLWGCKPAAAGSGHLLDC